MGWQFFYVDTRNDIADPRPYVLLHIGDDLLHASMAAVHERGARYGEHALVIRGTHGLLLETGESRHSSRDRGLR